jgi:hypothetical protein
VPELDAQDSTDKRNVQLQSVTEVSLYASRYETLRAIDSTGHRQIAAATSTPATTTGYTCDKDRVDLRGDDVYEGRHEALVMPLVLACAVLEAVAVKVGIGVRLVDALEEVVEEVAATIGACLFVCVLAR